MASHLKRCGSGTYLDDSLVRKSASSRGGDSLCGESKDQVEFGGPLVADMSQPLGDQIFTASTSYCEEDVVFQVNTDGEEKNEMLMDMGRKI